jgi:hypothetical protein
MTSGVACEATAHGVMKIPSEPLCEGVGEYLEKHLKRPALLAFGVSLVVAVAPDLANHRVIWNRSSSAWHPVSEPCILPFARRSAPR